eukprot:m.152648 g.152648  ORF g.152648 m.152648 type:complete len:57 (+) comp14267_c0_seq2:1798-1968(+)
MLLHAQTATVCVAEGMVSEIFAFACIELMWLLVSDNLLHYVCVFFLFFLFPYREVV